MSSLRACFYLGCQSRHPIRTWREWLSDAHYAVDAPQGRTPFPGLYTHADWPQAWSASAVFTVLESLVGIYPFAPANTLFLDPHLPDWLPEITIQRMRLLRHFACW